MKAARLLLRLLPATTVMPVVRGPLRGSKWVVGSAPHGAWLGRLEAPLLDRFVALLKPNAVVWDIGANVGLYTLAAARRVSQVVAFEPLSRNVTALRRHLQLNHVHNVQVVEAAVGSHDGMAYLAEGDSPSEAHIAPHGTIRVQAVSLDRWMATTGAPRPDVVKIDVEGAEMHVLSGATRSFAHAPAIVLAVHGDSVAAECLAWLRARRYRVSGAKGEAPQAVSEWVALPPES